MIIIQLDSFPQLLPEALPFPCHTFCPLKPPCLLISGVTELQIFLTVESWSLNARGVSRRKHSNF